jgi:hypothetical protein
VRYRRRYISLNNKSNQTIDDRIERLRKIALEQANAIIRDNEKLYKKRYIKNQKQPKISPEIIADQLYENFDLIKDETNIEQTARIFFLNIRAASRLEMALMSRFFAKELNKIGYTEKIINFYLLGYSEKSWKEWDALVEKNPNDMEVQALHGLRIGLCIKVDRGGITLDQATEIFESAREAIIQKRKEDQKRKGDRQKL